MKKIILIIFIAVTVIVGFSKNVLILKDKNIESKLNGCLESGEKEFISLDILKELLPEMTVFDSTKLKEILLILPTNIIVNIDYDSGMVEIEGGKSFRNGALEFGGTVYLNLKDVFAPLINLKYITNISSVIFYDEPVKITSIKKTDNEISIKTDGPYIDNFISVYDMISGSKTLTLSPFILSDEISDENFLYPGNDFVRFRLNNSFSAVPEVMQNEIIFENKSKVIRYSEEESEYGSVLSSFKDEGYLLRLCETVFKDKKLQIYSFLMDPKNFELSFVFANDRIASYESIDSMAKRIDSIALINGGYYDPTTAQPIGLIIEEGRVLSMPSFDRPILFLRDNEESIITRINPNLNVLIGDNLLTVKGVNTLYIGEVLLFTDNFYKDIPFHEGNTYIVIEDGKVKSVGYKCSPEKNESILSLKPSVKERIGDINPGEKAEIIINNFSGGNIDFAIEGGPFIINKGKPVTSLERDYYSSALLDTRAPRTLVGVKKDGLLELIVVDGYQNESSGLTFWEMVEFFEDKNFNYLMCLDGGRSSAIYFMGDLINNPGNGIPVLPVCIYVKNKL